MPLASWLFIKGTESIWIERPHGRVMVVAGPGPHREQRDFADDNALEDYQVQLAEQLTDAGWFLWGVNRERRDARDRRQIPRNSPDRRSRKISSQ